jgi:hypothetical protein
MAWKAFRDLWVAGTVGGFVAALMRSVPLDARALIHSPSGRFTFDLILRYVYMLWFIAYFLVSNLNKDEPKKFDIAFDIIQSATSFAAAFALGIAVRGEGYQFDRSAEAFEFTNGAILAICLFSLLFYLRRANWTKDKNLHGLRICGAVMAIVGLVAARHDPMTICQLNSLAITLLVLIVLLALFARMRINELPDQ